MTTIGLVVFDLAGTTVKDDGQIAICFQDAMAAAGYALATDDIYPLMGYKKPEAIRMMIEAVSGQPADPAEVAAIHDSFESRMVQHYQQHAVLEVLPNVERVFIALKKQGIKVGLDTGFSRVIADAIVDRLGWLYHGLADYLVASDEVPAGRPHPFMIQRMMEAAGITDAKQVVKVGDTEVDVHEGKNAGCLYSIAVTTGAFSREALLPHGPSHIIDDMAELLSILAILPE